ncbi:polyketide synthase [Beauveria bassiana ARSEF 2860]|uniref:Polyketide synthase n=1 Tax=Beauveria bassiana (strain ARSEF 2860) TaxID=655819 RepID=J4UFB9_BEAB2|nr:polyketide synthase [Beauveria bassiana ARSEF 2860]EJP61207.1 polyketide synthase [Beauveria bassiana ARSEF 2860]
MNFLQANCRPYSDNYTTNSQESSHNVLAQLISRATAAVKNEIQSLPTGLLRLFSSFESLFEWADDSNLRTGPLCGAVDGVLLVLVQLALYINHIGDDFARHRNLKQAHLAALGVGLQSGAAVSMAPVVADMPLHGAEAIVLAFRMGIHVQSISSQLESQDASERLETWAYVVHNVDPGTVQAELDALHGSIPGPNTNKIFISAISETSVTISGPPSRLKSLFQKSKPFRDATSIALPVYGGLCHAPHIYGSHDIHAIVHNGVKELHAKLEQSSEPMNMLHSTSSGDPYHAANGVELFELVVAELLTKAIEWNKVITSLVSCVKFSSLASITLNCFGKSLPLHDLEETLKESLTDTKVSVRSLLSSLQDPTSRTSTSRGFKQAKLAIVGMSCRLPGGATDTEKFWEVLENGLDVSREIPPDRFDIDTHFDAEGKDMNKTMTRYGCFIDDPASFDAVFFNMSPREALAVDPQMRLMLVTSYEALERAGFIGNRTLSTRLAQKWLARPRTRFIDGRSHTAERGDQPLSGRVQKTPPCSTQARSQTHDPGGGGLSRRKGSVTQPYLLWHQMSIPAMSAELERLFSGMQVIFTDHRSRLGIESIETTKCLKPWLGKSSTAHLPDDSLDAFGLEAPAVGPQSAAGTSASVAVAVPVALAIGIVPVADSNFAVRAASDAWDFEAADSAVRVDTDTIPQPDDDVVVDTTSAIGLVCTFMELGGVSWREPELSLA